MIGEDGNDSLDGGVGDDFLNGGNGSDVYLFGKGSGQDTIHNSDDDAVGTNADAILLGSGIVTTGLTLVRQYDSLIIRLNDSDDSLMVEQYFTSYGAVENIRFADGTVWDVSKINSKILTATSGNDSLHGLDTNETLNGEDGNDAIDGYEGNDFLNGGTGADTLKGGSGNDTLDGGAGKDALLGGAGADVYLFGKGSGQDTVYNDYGEATGVSADTILLGAGIATTDLTLVRQSDDLIISLNSTNDSLSVRSYFYNNGASTYLVENIKFADSTVWNYEAIIARLSAATSPNNVTVNGSTASEIVKGGQGNDVVYGNAGNDTLDGGSGNDTLDGGAGNDTYLGLTQKPWKRPDFSILAAGSWQAGHA